ncbi:MAG TPA: hypothetical protein DCY74_09600 [Clostridiales bacterium]|jgi:hypothetical protein|nr:hypothetical protein [Clostridiales bacterium]HBE14411.1 hypothetical protein [Clostridiales bacterium]HCG35878.1 hypothetical protein [Clostridiales bacterium]
MNDQSAVKRKFNIIDFLVIVFLVATILTLVLRSNLETELFSGDKAAMLEIQLEVTAIAPLHDALTAKSTVSIWESSALLGEIVQEGNRVLVGSDENGRELYKSVYILTIEGTLGNSGYVLPDHIPISANETFVCKTEKAGPFKGIVLSLCTLS